MPAAAVVEHFDVAADRAAGVVDARDRGAVDAFDFERGEERFGLGVVPADTGWSYRLADVEAAGGAVERPGCVLTAPVAVKNRVGLDVPVSVLPSRAPRRRAGRWRGC